MNVGIQVQDMFAPLKGSENMSMIKKLALFIILIFLIPSIFSLIFFPESLIAPVSAASCNSTNHEPLWGVEAANVTLQDDMYNYYENGKGAQFDEEIYYDSPPSPQTLALGTLTQDDDFSTSQVLENDSVSGLRLNLTTGQKYTFCITAQHLNNGTILGSSNVDVYLLTDYDWDIYERDYAQRNAEWRDFRNDVPIEWQSYMSTFYWKPFRDVHEYTDASTFEFSVALDQPQVSTSIWDEYSQVWGEFYLIIDGWDNIYDDAEAPGHDVQIDIQVMIEERFALPNWTVSLTCCGLFLVIAAIPAVLHIRYQKAGISTENKQLIPKISGTDTKTFGTMKEENMK